jgi:uncharacterized protein YbgA (DUF1722 family)/uncharacterized protein YbbK (DUF523 family)
VGAAAAASERVGSWEAWWSEGSPVRLGISGCLLGGALRFDGGHARDRFLTDSLGRWVEWVSVCPEVEVGMGTPRPTVRLVDEGDGRRLVAPSTGEDWTERMERFSEERTDGLEGLDGFVLKKGSPSCGMERMPIYRNGQRASRKGVGVFAETLMARRPELPVEEEGRLNDARLREAFVERVFTRHRWRTLVACGLTRGGLVAFHTAHKLLLFTHDEPSYRRLGRIVGTAGTVPDEELFRSYEAELAVCLAGRTTVRKHVNVLTHAFGHLKDLLAPGEKRAVLASFEDYRCGLVPLVAPLSLLRYDIQKHDVEYLAGQLYFDPYPKELMLRNFT